MAATFDNVRDMKLGCVEPSCERNPKFSVVFVGESEDDKPCWCIHGSCAKHSASLLKFRRREEIGSRLGLRWRWMRSDVSGAIDWIMADKSRSMLDSVSVAVHRQGDQRN